MTADDFTLWCEKNKARFAADFSRLTGTNRNTSQEYYALAEIGEDIPIKRSLALAMSAVNQGLKPWGEYERS